MPKFQKFNDGIAEIYSVENIAEKGDRPKEGLKIKKRLRFSYQTIGVKRNYEAKQAQVKLTELIFVPLHRDISSQDVAILFGKQYRIEQAQHDKETLPPITKLSLIRLEADYIMTLKQFRDLLLTVTDRVGHGEHFKDGGNYIVWHEVGKIGTNADNAEAESGFRIAVDYFTKKEYDTIPDKISALFDRDDIAADSPVIDFEPDTGYTHYAWTCEVI